MPKAKSSSLFENIKSEYKYPFSDINHFLIGCILYLLSIFVLPWVLLYGYVVRVYRSSLKPKSVFPLFNDLKNLFIDGLKYVGVMLAYLSVHLITLMIGIYLIVSPYIASGSFPSIEDFNTAYIAAMSSPLMITSLVLFYVSYFFIPMALIQFVSTGSLKKAFNLRLLFNGLKRSMPAYLAVYLIVLAADYLIKLLSFNYYTSFIQPIIGFYFMVFGARLFAKVYKTSAGKTA